jgi:hypothetical protein
MPIEAISSSACTMAYLFCPGGLVDAVLAQYFWKRLGQRRRRRDRIPRAHRSRPPYTQPSAAAALPSMKMRLAHRVAPLDP